MQECLYNSVGSSIALEVAFYAVEALLRKVRKSLFPKWLRKYIWHIFSFLLSVMYIYIFIMLALKLQRLREARKSPDEDGSDDEWGYGQTTAVLLWIPILRTMAKAMWGKNLLYAGL
jgi:hypothetical protein